MSNRTKIRVHLAPHLAARQRSSGDQARAVLKNCPQYGEIEEPAPGVPGDVDVTLARLPQYGQENADGA